MKNLKALFASFVFIAFFSFGLSAQSAIGKWKTVDDGSGDAKSHIEIYEQDGKLYGKIVKLLQKPEDTVCEKCPGKKKNQLLVGMNILEDLKVVEDYWDDGTILDPENGKEYSCVIWFDDKSGNELKVRGKHWTGLYRTQTWYKVD